MVAYLLLDQSSARHAAFADRLSQPDVRIVVSDVYFSEFTRASQNLLERHLERLLAHRDRLHYAVATSQCLNRELATLRRTTRDFVLNAEATVWVRQHLASVRTLAELITQPASRRIVTEDRYSQPEGRAGFRLMVREYECAMAELGHRAPFGTPIDDDNLRQTIKTGRWTVFNHLVENGVPLGKARAFAMKDTYMLRDICMRLCRFADWAQSRGIDGQSDEQLDNEGMDLEYLVIGSYFDEFLTADRRNQRNDANFCRLLKHLPRVREMQPPGGPRPSPS